MTKSVDDLRDRIKNNRVTTQRDEDALEFIKGWKASTEYSYCHPSRSNEYRLGYNLGRKQLIQTLNNHLKPPEHLDWNYLLNLMVKNPTQP